jgi:hypothetical protein
MSPPMMTSLSLAEQHVIAGAAAELVLAGAGGLEGPPHPLAATTGGIGLLLD